MKINRSLRPYGKTLTGGFNIPMPGNYIKMYGRQEEAIISKKLEEAQQKLELIVRTIDEKAVCHRKGTLEAVSLLVNTIWQSHVHGSDRKFFVLDTCVGCGLCAKLCPIQAVRMTDGRPRWNGACEECMACIQFCPQKAINTKTTVARQRYHHPQISSSDIITGK